MLNTGQKKNATVIVQCCVNNTKDIIKLVLKFIWNNQLVIFFDKRREIGRYDVELKILV